MTPIDSLNQALAGAPATIVGSAVVGIFLGVLLVVVVMAMFTVGGFWVGRRFRKAWDVPAVVPAAAARIPGMPGWMLIGRENLFWIGLCLVAVIGLFLSGDTSAQAVPPQQQIPTLMQSFQRELSRFVQNVMSGQGDLQWWSRSLTTVLISIGLFIEIGKFMMSGVDWESHFSWLLGVFAALAIILFYDGFTKGIWEAGEGVAQAMQMALINNTDTLYIGKWVQGLTDSVTLEEVGFFDAFSAVLYFLCWTVTVIACQLIYWIGAAWAVLGYSFAKMVGLIFVPFLALRATMPMFSAWFRIFLGSVMLLVALRGTSLVSIIIIKASFDQIKGGAVSYNTTTFVQTPIAAANFPDLVTPILMMILSMIFVLASFGLASALAGGIPDTSRGLQGGIAKTAAKLAKLLV